ncbi:MAG: cobalt-precorrin-5B (C(1))-methyltransferase CbiD [Limnospira sp. PMC 894.15]|uniref:Cobalt-precorrin-5B C(1)-methyltransferase n=1 Tax=Limnospira fusiformis PMC 851.14 TaxID=2219512 RepID=A0ABU9EHQ2_LIMFS|nr:MULTISPECIES: cobalt-precorrin-5B (C(1))-methyltransferase CbiD [unclassified Limnospira]MDT9189220.1 cobalt-precorrin-5B (C(1))-methyltransferase CbiD [Limnospira sp. PMC 894.15]MDT9232766.1 cobalt-precorrin-5B (C(1))-methyltransferase CbiD [Limnospira sp. PMC 917.15]
MTKPRSGYTLPVFACAAAIAALEHLQDPTPNDKNTVNVDLIDPPETAEIAIEQVARISDHAALGITRSDPGDNLDITRHTPVWAIVEIIGRNINSLETPIKIVGGEGVGVQEKGEEAAIYKYAKSLILSNLKSLVSLGDRIQVTIILPEGKKLAKRTSNEAFGVIQGLSLLGTTGISQPLSVPEQLEVYRETLEAKATDFQTLVFCIGENGFDLATHLGIKPEQIVKTANWLGPMLVTAGFVEVESILLFGYHGKLIKMAGGIFHTHHHLADGRLEILTAHCADMGLPTPDLQKVLHSPTTEDALLYLRELKGDWVDRIYGSIASAIDHRAAAYIHTHAEVNVQVGSVLFDRQRQIICKSAIGDTIWQQICYAG